MAKRPQSRGPAAPKFTELNDLCNETVGGKILFATDDWFAVAENLLQAQEPEWREGLFTACGKWMDGWETRRRRTPGHDWALLRLGARGIIRGVCVDTAFFTGNYAPRISLQAANLQPQDEALIPIRKCEMGGAASVEDLREIEKLQSQDWTYLLPMSPLTPGYEDTRYSYFSINSEETWTHLRLNLYPDGGIARLRVFGEARPDVDTRGKKIDLISMLTGGICVGYSDAHYGHPRNIIKPNTGENMGDGWETARRLDRPSILEVDTNNILQVLGNEWAIFQLGCMGDVEEIQVDTSHFKGNYPDSITIEGTIDPDGKNSQWKTLLPPVKLLPNKIHLFSDSQLERKGPFTHVRITISPDGGISRLRLWGYAT